MSTILKALRRLEHEKSAFEARPLQDEIAAVGPPPTRRSFPLMKVVLAATAALGLGLGASLLWLWPSGDAASLFAGRSMAPPAVAPAPVVPSEPLGVAVQPVPPVPVPTPEPVAEVPQDVEAPVASAPPPQAFASPVEVVERPEPVVAEAPAPAQPSEVAAAAPAPVTAANPQAPPKPGELPPFVSHRRAVPEAEAPTAPPPAPVELPVEVAK